MLVRTETVDDHRKVHALHSAAFERSTEADLVDVLRVEAKPVASRVAELDDEIVGHILFTPVSLAGHPDSSLAGLAPMAVLPGHQRSGIGSALIRDGLDACRRAGISAVVVLGHPEYYPRFGFVPASRFGIDSDYDVPDEVFMAQELAPGTLDGRSGRVSYHAAFAGA